MKMKVSFDDMIESIEIALLRIKEINGRPDHSSRYDKNLSFHEYVCQLAESICAEIVNQLGGELIGEAPQCKHGHMLWREKAKDKPGKDWGGYFCSEKLKANQCAPMWHVLGADGKWKAQA